MNAVAPGPDPSDMLWVTALTEGYVITFQGASIVAESPVSAGQKITAMLQAEYNKRQGFMTAPPPGTVVPTVEQPVYMNTQTRERVSQQVQAQGVPTPQTTPNIGPSQGQTRAPAHQTQPVPTQPVPTQPVPTQPVQPIINMEASRANLKNLVARRVNGEIKNDMLFYQYVNRYCPGISDEAAMDALDLVFEQTANQRTSMDGFYQVNPDEPPVNTFMNPGNSGMTIPQNGKPDWEAGLIDMSPADMIDDYVVDDSTGQILMDGR